MNRAASRPCAAIVPAVALATSVALACAGCGPTEGGTATGGPRSAVAAVPQEAGGQEADTPLARQTDVAELTPVERAIRAHRQASRGPEQPIPFSHRWHATELQISCAYCHTESRTSEVAVMPPTSVCMGCHRVAGGNLEPIAQLRALAGDDRPLEWVRVHKLPEFVQFTHQAHTRNQIECQTCHGPVEEMDRVYQWTPLTMGWCLECHRSRPEPADVATDYLLVRESPPPELPSGRQSRGLYPVAIDMSYGETRAPIDCATCHY